MGRLGYTNERLKLKNRLTLASRSAFEYLPGLVLRQVERKGTDRYCTFAPGKVKPEVTNNICSSFFPGS